MNTVKNAVCLLVLCVAWAPAAMAQQVDPVPQGLSGSASFGLSLTQWNSDEERHEIERTVSSGQAE